MTSRDDILAHKANGPWRKLLDLAKAMVEDAERRAGSKMLPRLGGGTRLMLLLEHRISDDIDLFIRDPQWINYLTPRLNNAFDEQIHGYDEGSTSIKFKIDREEIDFIVSASLTGVADDAAVDIAFALEPVEEILAKKLFYRGWALTPRDLFDWRALGELPQYDGIRACVARVMTLDKMKVLSASLEGLSSSDAAHRIWAEIKTDRALELKDCAEWAIRDLQAFQVAKSSDVSDLLGPTCLR